MKTFRELKIAGQPKILPVIIQNIENLLDDGWYRDKQREEKFNFLQSNDSLMYCFICSEAKERRASGLSLYESPDGYLYVSNIVPLTVWELSYEEYNYILKEFYQRFVVPAVQGMEVTVDLTDSEFYLEDWVSPEGASLLNKFSEAANKSNAASHPRDEERWYDFLIAAHKNNAQLDSSTLKRWLKEEGGWSEDIAFELAADYESAMSLLKYYDRHK